MKARYDVVIVGAGPAGIFAGLELSELAPGAEVLIVEKGHPLKERRCPARQTHCVGCPSCDIMTGWGGAGAFSDGKLTLSGEVGGWLCDFLDRERLDDLIEHVDATWRRFGASSALHGPAEQDVARLTRQAVMADMLLVPMRIRHMGTDRAPEVLQAMQDHLAAEGVEVATDTCVSRIETEDDKVTGVVLVDGRTVGADAVVLAPGREGADWLAAQARSLGIALASNAVDIGVRVEVPAPVMEPLTIPLYEAKLVYHSRQFGDRVRTFCMNPYGEVTTECYGDVVTVNGHSFSATRTENTNFAVLVSQSFTEPFTEPLTYGASIARLANLLGKGILVQRLGDLRLGRRSTPARIAQSVVRPSMPQATPGDLSFVLPYRHLADILEFLDRMEGLAPGVSAPGTLLYGVEVKFYSSRLEVDSDLMTRVEGLYAVGDGAGVTRGLVQSSASGVVAARAIARRHADRTPSTVPAGGAG